MGGAIAFIVGANGYSGGGSENDAGMGGAVFGMGGMWTIGSSENADAAVREQQNTPQLCIAYCVGASSESVTLGVGIIIPVGSVPLLPDVNGGKSEDRC